MMTIGTIGGPETFAGQTTTALRSLYGWMEEPVYFRNGEAMFAAVRSGEIDAAIGAGANLGAGPTVMAEMVARAGSGLHVVAEEAMPFGCHLLGAAGASIDQVERVYGGPASIAQAEPFLREALPAVETEIYSDPLATAELVRDGGGRLGVLGTSGLAGRYGLSVLAEEVDGGRINGLWWAISRKRLFDPKPERLLIAFRASDDGSLGRLTNALAPLGFSLGSAWPFATGAVLAEADYLLRFRGCGDLSRVEGALALVPSARLVGALGGR